MQRKTGNLHCARARASRMTREPPIKRGWIASGRRARARARIVANQAAFREDAGMDFEALGLLEGLEGDERLGREQLLARLAEEGFSSDELSAAVREDRDRKSTRLNSS